MKNSLLIICLLFSNWIYGNPNSEIKSSEGNYKLVVEGFDWGPAVNQVIITFENEVSEANPAEFKVFAKRESSQGEIPESQKSGERDVVFAFVSDENGNRVVSGKHITLVLEVSPTQPIGSPIQYMRVGNRGGNFWIDYSLTIINSKTNQVWNQAAGKIMPLVDEYDLKGEFQHGNLNMSYASFSPETKGKKAPLIIWLHGGGEGGMDPTIALLGNRAANYASPEIQTLFGDAGAYVLVPQSPTFWMQAAEGMTRGQTNDIYNEALFALIQDYVKSNPGIDTKRIYVGGCSNGGYMSLKLILEHPDYFAAGYISALAYDAQYVTEQDIQKIKQVPMWFVHSKDDGVTKPESTVVPLYDRLKKAGAKNVHFTFYDHVTDITGFYGGDNYHYNGHWSWIYVHANQARNGLDGSPVLVGGRPVTIMEWMATQAKK